MVLDCRGACHIHLISFFRTFQGSRNLLAEDEKQEEKKKEKGRKTKKGGEGTVATRTNKTFYIILGNISHLAGTSAPPENPTSSAYIFLFFRTSLLGSAQFCPSLGPNVLLSVVPSGTILHLDLVVVPLFRWWLGAWVDLGWVVVFIFATCEKNTLEHIKLRMLKMLYGFSVRFISILYVLFIYIRLCQPFHQMCLASLQSLTSVGVDFPIAFVVCVCAWVRFQFQIHTYIEPVVIVVAEE